MGLTLEKQCPAPHSPALEPVSQGSSDANPWHSNVPHLPLEPLTQPEWPNDQKSHLGEGPGRPRVFKAEHRMRTRLYLTSSWSFYQLNITGTQELVAIGSFSVSPLFFYYFLF